MRAVRAGNVPGNAERSLGYFRRERRNWPCNASALLGTSSARWSAFAAICANSAVYGYSARQAKQRIVSSFPVSE